MTLASVTGPELSAGDKLWFRCVGSQLRFYRYHAGAWTLLLSTTDSSFAAGGYLEVNARNTVVRLDDFGGGALR